MYPCFSRHLLKKSDISLQTYGGTFNNSLPTILLRLRYYVSKYCKTCVKRLLSKRPKIGFQDQLSLNAGQKYCRMLPLKYCRMLQGEHSAILLTFIKLPFVFKTYVLSIFECQFYTGFTVRIDWYSLEDMKG